jgi:tRNA-specific 2-thiouridylase
MANRKKKVVVAMSGGVDSSVSAALLVERGHDVAGAFMKNWSEAKDASTGECAWREERRDAMRVASLLGIPLATFDFESEYRRDVLGYMLREYEAGRTPNPDILCNQAVKFGPFLARAREELGADLVATGHYARIVRDATRTSRISSSVLDRISCGISFFPSAR